MTQSDNIKEFLKYASPRLEYIDHCMEKQALGNSKALAAVSKLMNLSDDAKNMYPRLRALSESDHLKDFAKLKPKAQSKAMDKALKDRRVNKKLTPLKPGWEAPSSKPKAKSNTEYGNLFDDENSGVDYLAHIKANGQAAAKSYVKKFKKGFLSDPRVTQEAAKRGITAEALFDEVAKHYASGFRGTPGANARGLRRLFDDATGGVYYNYKSSPIGAPIGAITDWAKAHPYLSAAGTAAGGSALGTGLGYAVGHSSGSEEAAKKLHTYYSINEALRSNALRSANSDILARLANIFGVGELNNLIGG